MCTQAIEGEDNKSRTVIRVPVVLGLAKDSRAGRVHVGVCRRVPGPRLLPPHVRTVDNTQLRYARGFINNNMLTQSDTVKEYFC